jgi:hypothetical protein
MLKVSLLSWGKIYMANYSYYCDGKQAGVFVRFEALQGTIILVETHYNQNLGCFAPQ